MRQGGAVREMGLLKWGLVPSWAAKEVWWLATDLTNAVSKVVSSSGR
ncbi:MAG: hypothetical protein ABW208_29200 [Pyrinomonadaceae bacterium]|jgi:hypothetical protein